ncbi:MAG: hypothetical protein ACXVAU_14420 [Mucilaginibacter sp.]
MNYLQIKTEVEAKLCPVHNMRPLVKTENDQIIIRCCCDSFTSKCLTFVDRKLNQISFFKIIDAWEDDHFRHDMRLT